MQLSDLIKELISNITKEVISRDSNRINAYQVKNYWALAEVADAGFTLLAKRGKVRGKDLYSFQVRYSPSEKLATGSFIDLEATEVVYSLDGISQALLSKLDSLLREYENEKAFFADSESISKLNKIELLMKKLSRRYEVTRYENSVTACLRVIMDDDGSGFLIGPRSGAGELDVFLESLEEDLREIEAEIAEKNRIVEFVKNLTPQMRSDIKKAMELKILS